MKSWRRAFARAAKIAFRVQQTLVFLCFLCFVLGFVFSLGLHVPALQPVLENTALYGALLLFPLEALFALALLVKLLAKTEEPSWTMLLTALIDPVIAYFAVCLFYGAAHF